MFTGKVFKRLDLASNFAVWRAPVRRNRVHKLSNNEEKFVTGTGFASGDGRSFLWSTVNPFYRRRWCKSVMSVREKCDEKSWRLSEICCSPYVYGNFQTAPLPACRTSRFFLRTRNSLSKSRVEESLRFLPARHLARPSSGRDASTATELRARRNPVSAQHDMGLVETAIIRRFPS